jgi:hypothetical protein
VRPPIRVLLTVSSPTVKGEINLISISLLKRRGKAGRRWAHFPFKTSSPMTSIPAVWMNLPSPRGFYATNIKAASARANQRRGGKSETGPNPRDGRCFEGASGLGIGRHGSNAENRFR